MTIFISGILKTYEYEINNSFFDLISCSGRLSDPIKFKVAVIDRRQYAIAAENKCKDMG
jgi:hypothetical protein